MKLLGKIVLAIFILCMSGLMFVGAYQTMDDRVLSTALAVGGATGLLVAYLEVRQ